MRKTRARAIVTGKQTECDLKNVNLCILRMRPLQAIKRALCKATMKTKRRFYIHGIFPFLLIPTDYSGNSVNIYLRNFSNEAFFKEFSSVFLTTKLDIFSTALKFFFASSWILFFLLFSTIHMCLRTSYFYWAVWWYYVINCVLKLYLFG